MMSDWQTFALYRHAPAGTAGPLDPIFGRPLTFYFFTLPVWQLLTGWLLMLAVLACVVAVFFLVVTRRRVDGRRPPAAPDAPSSRGLSLRFAALLLVLAGPDVYRPVRTPVRRSHRSSAASATPRRTSRSPACSIVAGALALGALVAAVNARSGRRSCAGSWRRRFRPAIVSTSASACSAGTSSAFIVTPEPARARDSPTSGTTSTRRAPPTTSTASSGTTSPPTPASRRSTSPTIAATLDNIRLWDWRALQDTLRQIQEIRTYYDFPDSTSIATGSTARCAR